MVPLHPSSTCPLMLKGWGWHAIGIVKSGRKKGDSWGRGWQAAEFSALMILASRIGLEESKLIPHTSFDTLFHIRCQNKSITGLEDIIGQVQLSASMLDFLENILKKTFFLSLILGHDGSTSPFVACDASTEFWEPCLGTCNGPSGWYGTGGGWLKNKNGLFGHGCIYIWNIKYMYQSKPEHEK